VRISYPVSRIERDAKLRGLSDEDYIEHALEITTYARDSGAYVIFSPYDTTRAELPFLQKVVREIEQAGTADRIRVVDTTGCALPEGVGELIRQIRLAAPVTPLEIHCHDDFGLACANTVAAVAAGAEFVSTTMTGLGERSGNAATEEVAMVLEGLYRIDTGLRLDRLTDLARLVSELVEISPAPNKPVVGENSFRHESGMIVAGLLNNPFAAEPYRPELVGQHRQILLGKKSGLASLEYKLDELGLDVPEDALPSVLAQVKELAAVKRSTLTDADVASIVSSVPAGGPVR
jgi:isopropylmalate/homocitrate/citramalate synthase